MKIQIKFLTSVFLLAGFIGSLQAQEIITTSANHGTTSNADVSWTIGEIIIETAECTNSILTQGFNQGDLLITKISNYELPGVSITVYPNPASNHLKLVISETNFEKMRFILYDLTGKSLINKPLTGEETDIQIGNLTQSAYLLKVFNGKKEITTFTIIKK